MIPPAPSLHLHLHPCFPAAPDVLPAAGRDPAAEGRALAEGHSDPAAAAGIKELPEQPQEQLTPGMFSKEIPLFLLLNSLDPLTQNTIPESAAAESLESRPACLVRH